MKKYVKIGQDIVNLESIARVSFLENQSGLSDRIVIDVGGATVVIDSGIVGKATLLNVREKLLAALDPISWDVAEAAE